MKPSRYYRLTQAMQILSGAIMASSVLFSGAGAHDAMPTASKPLGWSYGFECCSGIDCAQMPAGEIVPTPEGWRVNASGETIPYADSRVKRSRDEFFHRCAPKGDMTSKRSICIYVPDFGG